MKTVLGMELSRDFGGSFSIATIYHVNVGGTDKLGFLIHQVYTPKLYCIQSRARTFKYAWESQNCRGPIDS